MAKKTGIFFFRGGGEKVIPLYKEPKYSPHVPNLQKDVARDRFMETKRPPIPGKGPGKGPGPGKGFQQPPLSQQRPFPGQKPLVDLQVYEAAKPRPKKPPVDPALFMPVYTNTPYSLPSTYRYPYGQHAQYGLGSNLPIINHYSINASGPTADHTRLSKLYEDILPNKQYSSTFTTLGERMDIYNFVRSVFIKQHDGEDIALDENGDNSLLSYLKFIELNPYHTSHYTENPYSSLPDDMLIYRSCYPVRYDKFSTSVDCAKNSVGMNIRIYKLTVGEYNVKQNKDAKYSDYNVWREVAFYEYIRENIIKKKVSPNFPVLYAYYICEKCNIDFEKVNRLRGKYKESPEKFKDMVKEDQDPLKDIDWTKNIPPPLQQTIRGFPQQPMENIIRKLLKFTPQEMGDLLRKVQNLTPDKKRRLLEQIQPMPVSQRLSGLPQMVHQNQLPQTTIQPNQDGFSGKGLVALTESPNYNIVGWASDTYRVEGNIRRMLRPGFHSKEVWMSILFQLLAALYVMQIYEITFGNFGLEDNVYIKDVSQHGNITNYWKYMIDGIEYYIPNHGYVVMVDSNYKDIERGHSTLIKLGNEKFKIYGNIFDEGDKYDKKSLRDMTFEAFKTATNPNVFSKSFTNAGGSRPPEEIISLLEQISKDASNDAEKDIGKYIAKYMTPLMNNRIGTILRTNEKGNVRVDDPSEMKKGELVAHKVYDETYKFVLFLRKTENDKSVVLTKEDNKDDVNEAEISNGLLKKYSTYESIQQLFKPDKVNLNEDSLLEIYTINKN